MFQLLWVLVHILGKAKKKHIKINQIHFLNILAFFFQHLVLCMTIVGGEANSKSNLIISEMNMFFDTCSPGAEYPALPGIIPSGFEHFHTSKNYGVQLFCNVALSLELFLSYEELLWLSG